MSSVIVTAPVGCLGTVRLIRGHFERLRRRYTGRYIDAAMDLAERVCGTRGDGAPAALWQQPVTEGGVYAALWQLAEHMGAGLRIRLREIPVLQETVEVCNTLDVDPYRLASGGSTLIVTDAPTAMLEQLRAAGYADAALIGETAADRRRLIIGSDGGERYLTPPERGW